MRLLRLGVYYIEQRKMTSRHRTFSDWLNYCSLNCGCHEMSDFDINTLLVHHWDLWGFEDISLKVYVTPPKTRRRRQIL